MIRHSPSCMTVTHMASWPTTQRMLIAELKQAQGTQATKAKAATSLTPHQITLITPAATPPDQQRLSVKTTPKPLYP
jgi:hypothetical protein